MTSSRTGIQALAHFDKFSKKGIAFQYFYDNIEYNKGRMGVLLILSRIPNRFNDGIFEK